IQDMRNASTEITKQVGEFQKRHKVLIDRLIRAETRLQIIEFETQGPGTFIRHTGYREVEDVLGNKHQIPFVDVHDQRGVEGRVAVEDETIDVSKLRFGQRLLLLGTQAPGHVMAALNEFDTAGREASVVALMDQDHEGMRVMLAFGDMGENRVCHLAHCVADKIIGPGSRVLVDPTYTFVIDVLPEKESSRYLAAEIPTTTFADIGGLDHIAAQIEEDFIWPILHAELYKKAGLPSPRGCLLSGPPGTGKTMVARATANLIARQIEKTTGVKATSQFFYINGPELLNKYVGETERGIREIFDQAKKVASPITPAIIFIDEMDALFLTRGHGISSDVNLTIVPQFTTEMDGLEDRGNVMVIGATNRRELIDPAVLRHGRCDKIFEIPRPDAAGAKQIFAKYLLPTWDHINPRYDREVYHPSDSKGNPKPETYPFKHDPRIVAEYLINRAVERMYDTHIKKNEFIQLVFYVDIMKRTTKTTILRYGDLASGSLIANIVERAKKKAIHDHLINGALFGVEMKHLYLAIEDVFAEQRAPKTLEDIERWLMIQGHAEGPLAAPPRWIDHSKDMRDTSKKKLPTLPAPTIDDEDIDDGDIEEF
ncbi:MAG: AAA family ATPase, partial [Patescibacteria group bacterium]